jgi:type IV secretory pathway TraG/TraD family ATPase VirD4
MISSEGKTIANLLKKTPGCEKGYKYIVEHKSKQSLALLSVVMKYSSCFFYMKDGDNNFSINDWIENGTGNIFITNNAIVQNSLKPILSLFIDLLARKILSMPDKAMKNTVLLLDEFTTLNNLPSLVNLLTLGRSKGVSCYIGTQSFGQIENIYGKAHQAIIVNSCVNKCLFSMADSATAKYCSDLIGEAESVRGEKSLSIGSDYREGASLSYRHNTEPVVLTSEIMNLNDLEFIAKFANYPPVKSRLKYTDYPKKHDGFIMRSDLKIKKYVRPIALR